MWISVLSSTVRARDGLDGGRRCILEMQIIYTQPHNIYYCSRVEIWYVIE